MSFYFEATENPLKMILGMAGLSIDAICTDEKSRLEVRRLWKYHMQAMRFIQKKQIAVDRKRDADFLRSWRKSLRETKYYREEKPVGQLVSIREQVQRYFS